MTLTVTSLMETDIASAGRSAKLAFSQGADVVEVRLDHIRDVVPETVAKLRREILGPAIATLRSKREGGESLHGPEERAQILMAALGASFEYVDFELENDRKLLKKLSKEDWESEAIVSTHILEPVSRAKVEKAIKETSALGDIAKVAMQCDSATDALMLCEIGLGLAGRKKRYVLLGMGGQGQVTRAVADTMGSYMAFSCLEGKEAAPGQLDTIAQCNLLSGPRFVFGLIGHPVSHSVSKPMQEAALAALGVAGIYLPLDFEPGTLDRKALRTMQKAGFSGVNVTIPYKGKAFELCDEKLQNAEATNAVNTITFKKVRFVGENTDVKGFSSSIDGKIYILRDSKALLIGAGGVARAIAYVLGERGAKITITDIDMRAANKLARSCHGRPVTLKKLLESGETFDIVVNCSPVGMKGHPGNPIKSSLLGYRSTYFDVIYNPPVTEAMALARESGSRVIGGLEMLVQQGAESFRLWTGIEPNVYAMREAARRALE
ncbi:MAG: shikimate dehydrogenase [Thermoplasmata archaeon]|jgi:shikimate dehydrogenase/3-dehydroquinate dehydratase type I|nr:shikimate dehydrogenase [Thermoplasmata archaeon]